jgi:2-methylisocitrate lyase-like PEP mutase family enzyme
MEHPTKTLRKLLANGELIQAPGVADAMNARVVAKEGFQALYMTGSGTTSVLLGMPDIGLLTMTEMVDNAERIAEAAGIPLIADADTGYGNPINVRRTVRAYERAEVAAIHIEDQQWPKRCGHFSGKTLIPMEEMVSKVKAAVDARHNPDFIVIARTDAYSVEGFERAMERAKHYEEAGADVIFVEELRTVEELASVPRTFTVPTLFNMGGSGKTPFLTPREMADLGFKIVIYPNFIMRAQIRAAQLVLRELKSSGSIAKLEPLMAAWEERHDLLGMSEIQTLEQRYGVAGKARVGLKS